MKVLSDLAEQFGKLPGIGAKTAMRLAHHILFSMSEPDTQKFGDVLKDSKRRLKLCGVCFSISEADLCAICRNPNRDTQTVLVVADIRDLLSVEETGIFKGRYHVLGGLISPLQRIGPEKLRIEELKKRLRTESVREVILATVPTAEGEVTAHYLVNQLREFSVKVSRISAGIPVGGALEYMDSMTVTKAILNRQEMTAVKSE